jgi:hypothetical protein
MRHYSTEQTLIRIELKLKKLENDNKKIIKILDTLLNQTNESSKECKKMGEHIDFVEHVYENVKHPLNFICKKINYIENDESQLLENK